MESLRYCSRYPRGCADYGGRYDRSHIARRAIYREVGRQEVYHQAPNAAALPTYRPGGVARPMVRPQIQLRQRGGLLLGAGVAHLQAAGYRTLPSSQDKRALHRAFSNDSASLGRARYLARAGGRSAVRLAASIVVQSLASLELHLLFTLVRCGMFYISQFLILNF